MRRYFLIAWLLVSSLHGANVEPLLPTWDEADRAAVKAGKWFPGSSLLTDELPANEPLVTEQPPLPRPTAEELAIQETLPTQIADKFLGAYFNDRPAAFLSDPQQLLTAQQYRDRLAFLDYHAADASIDLFVYVFGLEQEIPGEVRAEELTERLFSSGRPAAVVYYFLGAPQRSVMYLSPSLTDTVSGVEQKRALQSSVVKSLEKADSVDQLEAFSVQMSIRLYWMERMLSGATVTEATMTNSVAVAVEKHAAPGVMEHLNKILPPRWWLPVSVICGAMLVAYGLRAWLRFRARYRFPEFEVEPRLGGSHAAGIGAVISFTNAAVPPAQQREQVPDYLRRV
jgi:hypothetical protein